MPSAPFLGSPSRAILTQSIAGKSAVASSQFSYETAAQNMMTHNLSVRISSQPQVTCSETEHESGAQCGRCWAKIWSVEQCSTDIECWRAGGQELVNASLAARPPLSLNNSCLSAKEMSASANAIQSSLPTATQSNNWLHDHKRYTIFEGSSFVNPTSPKQRSFFCRPRECCVLVCAAYRVMSNHKMLVIIDTGPIETMNCTTEKHGRTII